MMEARTVGTTRSARRYLVTGASSGIGLDIIKILVRRGDDVIAVGRRDKSKLPGEFPDMIYHNVDLADHGERNRLLDMLPASLDRVIHCAGRGHYRALANETGADIEATVAVNVTSAIHGLFTALASNRGKLGLVGSVVRRGASGMPVYAASKAALDGLARSLALEWRGRVDVKALHPGPTATAMSVRSGRPADYLDRIMLPPHRVARGILKALEEGGGCRKAISYGRILTGGLFGRAPS